MPELTGGALLREPESQSFQLHGGGEAFVKGRVIGNVDHPVGQFMEHQRDHAVCRQSGKAGVQRVIKPAKGGIGRHTANEGVEASVLELRLLGTRIFQIEVPPVGLAAENGVAPAVWLQREFGHGHQIDHHPGSVELHVVAEGVSHRQGQSLGGEVSGLLCQREFSSQLQWVFIICEDLLHRFPGHYQR